MPMLARDLGRSPLHFGAEDHPVAARVLYGGGGHREFG
jgi:hypothetical protein